MKKDLRSLDSVLRALVGGVLMTAQGLVDRGSRAVKMATGRVTSLAARLGFRPVHRRFEQRIPRQDRALFVATRCKTDPTRLQWARIEYRAIDLQRNELAVRSLEGVGEASRLQDHINDGGASVRR